MTGADDASIASDEESLIILAQVAVPDTASASEEIIMTQKDTADCHPINSNLILLDSQSAVNLFSNPNHVTNIHPVKTPIKVHCNKGTLSTTQEADFGDTPVYLDAHGIANVLSRYRLGKKFLVTYNSRDCGGVFQVHAQKGIVEFKPTPKGLHTLNLKDNPDLAITLVNGAELQYEAPSSQYMHVTTVCDNYKGYTKKQIEQAIKAPCLMSMVGSPSEHNFQGLVCNNLLHDCPITNHDITTAHAIFGPDFANIRGKRVRRNWCGWKLIMWSVFITGG